MERRSGGGPMPPRRRDPERFFDYPRGFLDPRGFFDRPFWTGFVGSDYGPGEPAVDVFETDQHMVVKAELPGLDPGAVKVTVTEDAVSLRGETTEEREENDQGYHWRERHHGVIQRHIPLARRIDPESARASFRHGVLTLRALKAGTERGRTVEVKIESDQAGYGDRH